MKNKQENVSAVIKIKRERTWQSALGWMVRKGPSEEVMLGNTRWLSLKSEEGILCVVMEQSSGKEMKDKGSSASCCRRSLD